MTKLISRFASVLIVAVLLAVVVVALRPRPLDVDIERVTRGPLDEKVTDDGRARVRERYTVSAPVAGTLARIELNEGDAVEAGTVLARLLPLASPLLDPRSRQVAEQRLASSIDAHRQAAAAVARSETASDQAKRDLVRVEALARNGSAPEAELEQAQAEARIREAELSSAHFSEKVAAHDIEQARAALERFSPGGRPTEQFEVTCPVHGRVLHVLRKSEGVVDPGAALIEVGDPQALELVVDVLSEDAVLIRAGMPASVVHWGGPKALGARVRRVDPSAFTKISALGVDEQRVNVILDLEGSKDDWRALGDGFGVEIEITVWSQSDVVQAPTSALFRDGEGWAVFVVENDRAVVRNVDVGHRGPLRAEIKRGLATGEVLILHPGASVHAGVRVSHR
jgi:HlyD family secretion protein